MQRKLTMLMRSEEEEIKDAGLHIDFDEIARRGAMSKEEKAIAKWYGIYSSRQPGNFMSRIVIPGGVLTSSQARNIARLSSIYGRGVISLTTRQAIQYHWLQIGALADVMRGLAEEGSTTIHGCGDVTRNVAACQFAENCRYNRFNVRPYAIKTMKYLGDSEDLDNLPRKFKISFSGCSAGCGQPYINCVGAIAKIRKASGKEEQGFQITVGGGMGWDPYVGQEFFSFIPEARMLDVARAIALTYRDHGDRFNRAKSRMRVVVARYGIEQVRKWVLEKLKIEGKSIKGLETKPVEDIGLAVPDRPLADFDKTNGSEGAIVGIIVPKGELNYIEFEKIAELSEIYGDQRLYTTNRQNLEIHGVRPEKAIELKEEIHKLNFQTEGFFGLRDMVSCVGTTYCPKAVTETRALFDKLVPVVQSDQFTTIAHKVLINITGCPNSCSPYRIVDIGFRGMRIREESGSVEGYEMLLGGDQKDFGKKLGEFKLTDIPEIVKAVLEHFLHIRQNDETLTGCVNRVGIEEFKKAVLI